MVIRLTLGNSLYIGLLNKFVHNLYDRLICMRPVDTTDMTEMQKEFARCSRVASILNPENTEQPSSEDMGFISSQVRTAFNLFCKRQTKYSDDWHYEYFLNNLQINISDGMVDKNENDCVVYWLRRSGKVIVQ